MGPEPKLEFEYLAGRPQDVPLIIDWRRAVWTDRMGSYLELARDQLLSSPGKTELQIIILSEGLYSKLGWEPVAEFTHMREHGLRMRLAL